MTSSGISATAQRLLVISDTHGHVHALEAVFNWAQDRSKSGGIRATAFLGDGASDLSHAANSTGFFCEWRLVRGNNDFDFSLPASNVFDFCGHRFYLCHGHRSSLYSGYNTLVAAAQNLKAEAALFGHTHIPYCKSTRNVLLVNPGSVGRPRSQNGATFAVIGCEEGEPLVVEFWAIDSQGKIERLTDIKQ